MVGVGDELSLLVTLLVAWRRWFPFLGKSLSYWRELLAAWIAKPTATDPLATFQII